MSVGEVSSDQSADTSQQSQLLYASSNSSSPEVEKMKSVIRQLFRDKEKLKESIEEECKAHVRDVSRIAEETKMIQLEIDRLNEANDLPPPPSPQEEARIASLAKQLSELKTNYKSMQIQLADSTRVNSVLQKEVEQHKMTVSTLEADLMNAEENKLQCVQLKSKLMNIQNEKREKQRKIDELVISERFSEHELQKVRQKLNLMETEQPILLNIESAESFSINQPISPLPSAVKTVYNLIENNDDTINDNEKINSFLLDLPHQIHTLREENERLSEQCTQYQSKYEKIIEADKAKESEAANAVPPETMKEIVMKLSQSNQKKAQKIKELKDIADRQHAALQRLVGVPTQNASIISSLRHVLNQLGSCDQGDIPNLCEIGERLLDAMVGVEE